MGQKEDMFEHSPPNVLYCYGIYQDMFQDMEKTLPFIEFHEGLPNSEQLNSIKEIVIKLRVSMGKSPVNVVRFPIVFLKYLLFGLGKKSVYEHLFLSLRMDCTKAKEVFDWTPVVNINDELNRIGNCRSYND